MLWIVCLCAALCEIIPAGWVGPTGKPIALNIGCVCVNMDSCQISLGSLLDEVAVFSPHLLP